LIASPNTVYSERILRAPTHVHSRSPVVTPTHTRCWPSLQRYGKECNGGDGGGSDDAVDGAMEQCVDTHMVMVVMVVVVVM